LSMVLYLSFAGVILYLGYGIDPNVKWVISMAALFVTLGGVIGGVLICDAFAMRKWRTNLGTEQVFATPCMIRLGPPVQLIRPDGKCLRAVCELPTLSDEFDGVPLLARVTASGLVVSTSFDWTDPEVARAQESSK